MCGTGVFLCFFFSFFFFFFELHKFSIEVIRVSINITLMYQLSLVLGSIIVLFYSPIHLFISVAIFIRACTFMYILISVVSTHLFSILIIFFEVEEQISVAVYEQAYTYTAGDVGLWRKYQHLLRQHSVD